MMAIRWTLTMGREMGNCTFYLYQNHGIQKIILKINYHDLIPIKWIFWIGFKTFLWLHLLDTGYDKHLLICPKICCRLSIVKKQTKKCQMILSGEYSESPAFIKTNFIWGNFKKIVKTIWWLIIIGVLKVGLHFVNIWFTNLYFTCYIWEINVYLIFLIVQACLFKMYVKIT